MKTYGRVLIFLLIDSEMTNVWIVDILLVVLPSVVHIWLTFVSKFCDLLYNWAIHVPSLAMFLYARLQTGRIMVWWCPSVRPSAHFLHFSHTCFDIMSWNFAHDFVLMYYRSSLSVVTLRQFLYARRDVLWYGDVRPSVRPGLRPPLFRTFLLHALTYWAEILHMTLF